MSRKDSSQDVTLLATQEKRTITINKNRVGIAKSLGMGQDDCKERKGKRGDKNYSISHFQ